MPKEPIWKAENSSLMLYDWRYICLLVATDTLSFLNISDAHAHTRAEHTIYMLTSSMYGFSRNKKVCARHQWTIGYSDWPARQAHDEQIWMLMWTSCDERTPFSHMGSSFFHPPLTISPCLPPPSAPLELAQNHSERRYVGGEVVVELGVAHGLCLRDLGDASRIREKL